MCSYRGRIIMNRFPTSILLLATSMAAAAQMSDFKGYKDPALFTRMPHYFLPSEDSFAEKAFDAYEFQLKAGTERVEGRHLLYAYSFDEAAVRSFAIMRRPRAESAASFCGTMSAAPP